MTFLELQQELIAVPAARFREAQRAQVKRWINDRYAEIWGLEDWTFRKATATFAVTAGSADVTEPADIGIAMGLWNNYGEPLEYLSHRDYLGQQLPAIYAGASAIPTGYTVIGKQLKLTPTPSESGTYTVYYEKALTLLSNDGDVPALPIEHHYILVHGAMSTGQVMMNDFTYQFAEQRWANELASMRQNYLADMRGEAVQWGRA